jgi:hypothetical protein
MEATEGELRKMGMSQSWERMIILNVRIRIFFKKSHHAEKWGKLTT